MNGDLRFLYPPYSEREKILLNEVKERDALLVVCEDEVKELRTFLQAGHAIVKAHEKEIEDLRASLARLDGGDG